MKKSERTKEKILEIAVEMVALKGYSSTTTKEIAKRAGVSEATIFKYYATKDELLKKIVIKTLNEFYEYSVTKSLPEVLKRCQNKPIEIIIKSILIERLTFLKDNFFALRVVVQEMMINDTVMKLFKEQAWQKISQVMSYLYELGVERGEIKDIGVDNFSKLIFSFIVMSLYEWMIGIKDPNTVDFEKEVNNYINNIFIGINL
ncbi:MAG: TetR/AcrR family transcriptional regulator [Eubacteriales bacterium]